MLVDVAKLKPLPNLQPMARRQPALIG